MSGDCVASNACCVWSRCRPLVPAIFATVRSPAQILLTMVSYSCKGTIQRYFIQTCHQISSSLRPVAFRRSLIIAPTVPLFLFSCGCAHMLHRATDPGRTPASMWSSRFKRDLDVRRLNKLVCPHQISLTFATSLSTAAAHFARNAVPHAIRSLCEQGQLSMHFNSLPISSKKNWLMGASTAARVELHGLSLSAFSIVGNRLCIHPGTVSLMFSG